MSNSLAVAILVAVLVNVLIFGVGFLIFKPSVADTLGFVSVCCLFSFGVVFGAFLITGGGGALLAMITGP